MANLTRARQKTSAAASLLLLFLLLSALPPSNAWGGATSTASAARSLLRPSKVAALNGRCPPRPRFPSRGAGQTLRGKCASCPRTCLSSSRSSSCSSSSSPPPSSETALFSCGCFWKPQQLFDATPGVLGTAVGYCRASSATGSGVAGSGGAGDRRQSLSSAAAAAAAASEPPTPPPPTYESVCGGDGFTETVMVEFDPNSVTYARLLEVFWRSHDASVLLPKPQYQSALWPLSPAQHQEAQRQIRALSSKAPSKAPPQEEQLQQRPQQPQQLQQLQPVEQQEGLATGRRPSGSPATVLVDLRHHHQDHQGHLGANDQGGQSTPLASPSAEFAAAAAAAANASAAVPDRAAAAAAAQAPMSSLTSAEFWRAEGYHQDFWPKMRPRAAALALLVVVQYAAFPVASSLVNLPGDATHMSMGGGEGASIPQFSSFLFSSSSHILYSRAKAVVEWSTALQVVVALELAYQRLVGPQLSRLRRRTDHTAALSFGGPQRRGHEKKKNLPSQQVG